MLWTANISALSKKDIFDSVLEAEHRPLVVEPFIEVLYSGMLILYLADPKFLISLLSKVPSGLIGADRRSHLYIGAQIL